MHKRFILVRQGPKKTGIYASFPKVVIHDTSETIPATINGFPTRIYKPVSEEMNYLDAYPIMAEMNRTQILML